MVSDIVQSVLPLVFQTSTGLAWIVIVPLGLYVATVLTALAEP